MRKILGVLLLCSSAAMAAEGPSRHLILRASREAAVHTWLTNHPSLDVRQEGGGAFTFRLKLNLLSDPVDCSVVRAYGASWRLSDTRRNLIRDEILSRGWKVNTTDNDNDLSHYREDQFTWEQALADTTRKPVPLKVCEEP